ncbi:MAG: redoxin domain-containing protein [Bacteroidia bacterium]|nr:redoxin domain-containing protein [Bacteroidia bacterium]
MTKFVLLTFVLLGFWAENFAQSLKIGDEFPSFNFQGQFQKQSQLSDYKGSFVLIHFWASWNEESRTLQQSFTPVYSRFREKRFTKGRKFYIISVSIDEVPKHYELALKKDNLPWNAFVCDFIGWKTPLLKLAGVEKIPSNFLLDPYGRIMAMNLNAQQLEKILREQ